MHRDKATASHRSTEQAAELSSAVHECEGADLATDGDGLASEELDRVVGGFFAYDPAFRGGVYVSTGD